MAVELLKIGVKMRKGLVFTMRGCFRSVCNHPFVVVLLSVLIYMYRSSPFMFSLLVYASPVLVCTAVLLGTLLFFGQSNLPEEKTAHEAVTLKTELLNDEKNVEKNEGFCVERFSEGEQSSVGMGSVDASVRLREGSMENELKSGEIVEGRSEVDDDDEDDDDDDKREKQTREWNEERLSDADAMENHYSSIQKGSDVESEYERSEADYLQVERHEDEDDDSDSGSGSGSDPAESSSPDASMADIIPMIDELHPLLDEEGAQPVQMSRGVSDAPSSSSASSISTDSVDETDNQEDSEVADDEIDDEGDKEERKAAITWTEEDQKNLMDLGSSEIERNQRLESLIMRRRSRKFTSMVPEIDLIDLENSDFPTIASINTARQNPFDMPHDSYGVMELPPIPGSAPSVLVPRRNPFDVPFDSAEEKPNPMGDGLQEEVNASQSRETFFKRRESFHVGPSVFAPTRQDVKWRPYFVPERTVLEESSFSAWPRQPSERSDSKTSSVPETESVSSVEDLQDQKLEEEDDPHEVIEDGPPGDQDQVSNDESQSSDGDECLKLGSIENGEIHRVAQDSSSEAVEQIHSRRTSASSLSEIDGQDLSMSNGTTHDASLQADISRQISDLSVISTLVDDAHHKEPVYDSSPTAGRGHDSINSDFYDKSDENVRDQQTEGDKSVGELEEEKHLPVSEQESRAPVEVRLGVQRSVDKDETVQSPNSDSDYHESIEKIPTPTAGGGTSRFYDGTMHELDFEHAQEVQVPNTPVESFDKVRSIQNIHIPEAKLQHDVSKNTESSLNPASIAESVSHVDSHDDTQTILEKTADEIKENHSRLLSESDDVGENHAETSRNTNTVEAISHVDTQTILEGAADEIKENHSRLLSESDSAGEKHADSAETSRSTNTVEVDSDETHKIEHEARLENTKEEIVHDERANKIGHEARLENTSEEIVHDESEVSDDEDRRSASSDEGKGRSKTSTSSSSSSSSDSEANMKAMIAKRRLSTPF